MNLGTTLRQIRLHRNLNLTDVAGAAGCSPGFISLVERGERNPTLDTLQAIAQALDVPLLLLVYGAESDRAWMQPQTATWLKLEWAARFPNAEHLPH
jgi:transcriptional regulator with XRE-family HTH domain